jgi:hypothetical protein
MIAFVCDFTYAELIREFLQLAVLVALARVALEWVIRKDEFEYGFASLAYLSGMRQHLHAFLDFRQAGGHQTSRVFHIYKAQAARADGLDAFQVAERRDSYAVTLRNLQNRFAFLSRHGLVVDS